MKRGGWIGIGLAGCVLSIGANAGAQSRTPWQMNFGVGVTNEYDPTTNLVKFNCVPSEHGDPCEYDVAVVPPVNASNWVPAPDPNTIDFLHPCGPTGSVVCSAPNGQTCEVYGDFTFFQTLVDVPLNVQVTTFTITFQDMDDGSRVSIYNSKYPNGLVIPGSYVFLGGSGTTNLAPYVVSGETNRVVITQVDDCCCANNLGYAAVVLNGQVIPSGCQVTGCDDGNACTTDVCQTDGSCSHTPIGCNDGNPCTVDSCNPATGCVFTPYTCAAPDQCHQAGTCNGDGTCSFANLADGTACSDGNACTQTDTCQNGVCVGSNPVVCTASDQCHVAGTCDTTTGLCSNPNATDGTSCNDGNACTQSDVCTAGACAGSPYTCAANDQCHQPGVCNGDGTCFFATVTDGSGCNDGNACTQTDVCQSGVCTGTNPVVCTAIDQCHVAGVCSPSTGACSNPNAQNGTGCNDGNACTQTDICQSGVCTGTNPIVCTASDQCHVAGTCNPSTGACSNPAAADGTPCNDGNACTTLDACLTGACKGGPPLNCDDGNRCTLDQCAPATGCYHTYECPDCSAAAASVKTIWPPNHKFVPVGVQGVTDPHNEAITITIDDIAQDEPTLVQGSGDTCPDGEGVGTSTAQVRAERTGDPKVPGDGRVYHISYTATNSGGYYCTGTVTTCVPHDQGAHSQCVDEGPRYDSLLCQ